MFRLLVVVVVVVLVAESSLPLPCHLVRDLDGSARASRGKASQGMAHLRMWARREEKRGSFNDRTTFMMNCCTSQFLGKSCPPVNRPMRSATRFKSPHTCAVPQPSTKPRQQSRCIRPHSNLLPLQPPLLLSSSLLSHARAVRLASRLAARHLFRHEAGQPTLP
ncbi:hypothetical protein IWX90DRAFT_443382 [Phyllosticta citrichinensis]|uniref:Secreted protein n=1 Tax=Phyllosticta citrichinensis TaxID=1130410 RepID=A0ABR1XIM1_9PEZI